MNTFFFSSRRRHTRCLSDWSSDVCSSDLNCLLQVFAACGRGFFSTNNAIQCMVVFIEWFYQASLPKHTEGTLALMNDAFRKFNKLKEVFVNMSLSSLKFPKMHMLTHFKHFIHHCGTLDNMDTEIGRASCRERV